MPGCVGVGEGARLIYLVLALSTLEVFFLDVNMILGTEHSLNFQKL